MAADVLAVSGQGVEGGEVSERDSLIERAMSKWESREELCHCDDCRRITLDYFNRVSTEKLRKYGEH